MQLKESIFRTEDRFTKVLLLLDIQVLLDVVDDDYTNKFK